MIRRLHVPALADRDTAPAHSGDAHSGGTVVEIDLPDGEARHAASVLRLSAGDAVEVFDDAGRVAGATIVRAGPSGVRVRLGPVRDATGATRDVAVASAVPKGDRADWIAEKLGELGVAAWSPVVTARSVVVPGANKVERWRRIAVEAAKQSRRAGVMSVHGPAPLADVLASPSGRPVWLSTDPSARPFREVVDRLDADARREGGAGAPAPLLLLVGPEGGWTDAEAELFADAGATPARLTRTVLRVETAAVVAAAMALTLAVAE